MNQLVNFASFDGLTRQCHQIDNYHGTIVADPYRWLENLSSAETGAWIDAQNRATDSFLSSIPERASIKDRLTELWDYEKIGSPKRKGKRTFYSGNSGLENQNVLYVIDNEGSVPRVLIDPNTFSSDGTVALSGVAINEEGTLIAYGISRLGSDWQEWRIRDVATGEDLEDCLKWVKFSGASWLKDGSGFFYCRYDEPAEGSWSKPSYNQKLFFHRVGTLQCQDQLVYERPDQKEWRFGPAVTEDGRYLLIYVSHAISPKNRIFYKDLRNPDSEVVELFNKADALYSVVKTDSNFFWIVTDLDAPRGRLVEIDLEEVTFADSNVSELIPESKDTLLTVTSAGNRLFAHYLRDNYSRISEYELDGTYIRDVELPGIGSVCGFVGDSESLHTYYSFSNYTTPGTIYRYNIETGKSTVFFKPDIDFDAGKFVTEQIFVTSNDGTRVPLFINYKKGLKRNGSNPTYLYGYGGFKVAMAPGFSVETAVWMEMGGIFAYGCLRGGGEYGEEWHQAGTKMQKQNVFDDFINCAEWLIDNKYTSEDKLAIGGDSNGGLLVGACMTQRPELFAAACPSVGLMDMLRFHKYTVGWSWVEEFGCSDNPDQFEALYAYSPLHNIVDGVTYPSTLVYAADHDDHVVPSHSFKFFARLNAAHSGSNPVVLRVDKNTGHGAGKPASKVIQMTADRWAFLSCELNIHALDN